MYMPNMTVNSHPFSHDPGYYSNDPNLDESDSDNASAISTTTAGQWTDATSLPSRDDRDQQHGDLLIASMPESTSPPGSEITLYGHSPSRLTRDAVPWPGRTYLLLLLLPSEETHNPDSNRALALFQGRVRLINGSMRHEHTGCWHWVCEEKGGWLGLRNGASWTYLGRNMPGEIEAKVTHHRDWEYLCARRHPDGGYLLLNVNLEAKEMERICIAEDGCGLVLKYGGEARWEFVEVHL